jgi:hypothetical protein
VNHWDGWHYLDDNNREIPCHSEADWQRSWEQKRAGRWRVGRDEIDGVDVSTVFLGLDHALYNYGPICWETMVFGGPFDMYQRRYASYEQAVSGHARTVEAIKAGRNPDPGADDESGEGLARRGE